MDASKLGLRYERLLILAGPLTLAAFVVLFVAVASDTQNDRIQARCYQATADTLNANSKTLSELWDKEKPVTKSEYWGIDYRSRIAQTLIDGLIRAGPGIDCYDAMKAEIDKRSRASPSEIVEKLRHDAKALLSTPLQLYGIELPEQATINLLGTNIKVGLLPFTQVLQLVLAPLLILWLGSLYNTRFRESILIGSAANLADIFPHLINIYPSGQIPPMRKPNWLRQNVPNIVAFLYFATRVSLLTIFVAPPVVVYIFSLYYLHSDQYIVVSFILGTAVAIFGFAALLVEGLPWHYKKIFPGAANVR